MGPERRLEGLASTDPSALEHLADRVLETVEAQVLDGPQVVTAPVRLPVPGTPSTFVAGRAVLTRCTVVLDGVRGDGIVQGRELHGALAAAVCDAEAERRGPLAGAVAALAGSALLARASRLAVEDVEVDATRLDGEHSG